MKHRPVPNAPDLWQDALPVPSADGHKYNRGHLAVLGAPELTGATRLAASAASRAGAGLVSVLSEDVVANVYRTSLPPDIMVSTSAFEELTRTTTLLAGPGGLSETHQDILKASTLPAILDADALQFWPDTKSTVLTPHSGEFARVFPDITGDRLSCALEAASLCHAVIVLKGAETIIAEPEGRTAINTHASPYLAKAGTGDVLTGIIAGLITQGMPTFQAACAAVWLHGEIGLRLGPGLIASDLIDELPAVLMTLVSS